VTHLLKELKEKLVETLKLADVHPEETSDDEPLFGEGLGLDSIFDRCSLTHSLDHTQPP
jgi:acyl carrier protein